MKTTIKAILHWTAPHEWDDKAPSFEIYPHNMELCGPRYVAVREVEIEVDVPDDFDPRSKQVEILRDQKTKVLAEAQAKVNNLDDQIHRLLALECKEAA